MDERLLGLLKALVTVFPELGRWLVSLARGEADAKRHVADILPEQSASAEVLAQLRGQR